MAKHARTAPPGRHRVGRPGRVRAVTFGMTGPPAHWPARWLRRLRPALLIRATPRHSYAAVLARSGVKPRPVLALILSL